MEMLKMLMNMLNMRSRNTISGNHQTPNMKYITNPQHGKM